MRHAKKKMGLSKAADQRLALLRSLSRELVLWGQIRTTLTRAKRLRPFCEPLISRAIKAVKAEDSASKLHQMRQLRRHLAKDTFEPLLAKAAKLTDRNGGYLRIIKLSGTRRGDDTQMALVQFVD